MLVLKKGEKFFNKEEVMRVINLLREDLINIGMKEGFNSKRTIEVSQLLDIYINKYQFSQSRD